MILTSLVSMSWKRRGGEPWREPQLASNDCSSRGLQCVGSSLLIALTIALASLGSVGSNAFFTAPSSNISLDIDPLACLLSKFFVLRPLPIILPLLGFVTFVGLLNEGTCDFAEDSGRDEGRWG